MSGDGLITVASSFSVRETVEWLVAFAASHGLTVFARIDHADGASPPACSRRPPHRLEAHVPDTVRDNPALNRFELDLDGHTAAAYYELAPGVITFRHTEVPPELSGHGIGSKLVRGALEAARAQGLKVVPKCPFVAAYMAKHAEFNDLLL